MSSRDNLKQLMKKQQLLFDAMETKPAFINRDRRYDIKKNDSQSASSKLLNNSGYSQPNNDNSSSNIQASFQTRNNDKSNDKINISQNKVVEHIKPIDFLKKGTQQKTNPDLYNQFLQSRNLQKDDANKVQKFINDVFSSNTKGSAIKTQLASRNSTSNSPYRQDMKLKTGLSPQPQSGTSTVSRLYNQIHCKIDNRVKLNVKQVEENQFPQIGSKQIQQKLIEKYLSVHPKQRQELLQDQIKQRGTNPIFSTTSKSKDHDDHELRPRTEGYQQKKFEDKKQQINTTIDIKLQNYKKNTQANEKESSFSTTTNNESKTDCEKVPKTSQQKSEKDIKNIKMKVVSPHLFTKALNELPLEKIICQEEGVFTILAVITRQTKVTKLCKNYITLLTEINLEPLQVLYENDQLRILERSFLLERISVMVILIESLGSQEDFEENTQNIKNLLLYCHNNQISILENLLDKYQNIERSKLLLEARLKQLQNNRMNFKQKNNMDKVVVMKKNNNVIFSILTLIIENPSKDNYSEMEKILSGHQQLSLVQENGNFQKFIQSQLQHINHLRLSSDTQLTEKTFDVDFENNEKGLEDDEVKVPYLPKRQEKAYTLVLDLDETLVHYQELSDGGQFLVRPYAEQFLQELSKYYEIVIFTAALQDYADFILDIIDNNHVITHRLYRQHTTTNAGICVKDLFRLGRDLANTLIVDNLPENFSCQPDNGIYVQSWFGEPEDRALFELAPLLKEIVKKKVGDVRVALRKFRDKMLDNISKGIQDPHLNLSLD